MLPPGYSTSAPGLRAGKRARRKELPIEQVGNRVHRRGVLLNVGPVAAPGDAVSSRPGGQDPWSASVHCQLGPGEAQMRARTETIELGERVSRALTMENSGPARRRIWWIVSSAVLAPLRGPQAV